MENDVPSRVQLALERVGSIFRSELRRVATEHELKLVQLEALVFFSRANRYSDTPAALCEYLGLTKGTVSQTVSALERRGLLTKKQDADDRRKQRCTLTKAGRVIADAAIPLEAMPSTPRTASALEGIVRDLQRANGYRSFGICRSCRFHEVEGGKARCGLTKERLTSIDTERICREHEAA